MSQGYRSKDRSASYKINAGDVQALALKALDVLALSREEEPQKYLSNFVDISTVCSAFLSDREFERYDVIARLREDGVTVDELVDFVIPETAYHLQTLWHQDHISFAEVTIAAARLQEALHIFAISTPVRNAATATRILLIVPRQERHTLGMFVIAHQLRRQGFDVDLALGLTPAQIRSKLESGKVKMIGLTCAGAARLTEIKTLISEIRASVGATVPIVLGGSFVGEGLDLKRITGCDHATNDIQEALTLCGLETTKRDDPVFTYNADLKL